MSDTESRPGTPDSISTYDELQTHINIARNHFEQNLDLQRRLNSAEQLNQELGAQNAQLIARLTEHVNEYADQLERNDSLEQEKAYLEESSNTLAAKNEEMQLEIQSAKDARRQLQQEKETLEIELDRLRSDRDVVQEQREVAESDVLILKHKMDGLESENEQLKREMESLQANNNSLTAENEKMRLQFEREMESLQANNNSLTAENEEMRLQFEREMESLQANNNSLTAENEKSIQDLLMRIDKLNNENERLIIEGEQDRVYALVDKEDLLNDTNKKFHKKLKRRDASIQKLKYGIQIQQWCQKERERELKRRQASISNESSTAQYREDESARQHNTNSVTPANQYKRNRSTLSNITNSLTAASTSKSPDKKKKKSISNNASNNARLEPATLSIRESLQPPVNVFDPHMRVSTDVSKKASRSKQASTRMARTSSRPSFRVSSRPLRQKSLLTIEKSILSQASKQAERVSTRAYMSSKDSFPSSNDDEEESDGEENSAEVCKEWECELKPSRKATQQESSNTSLFTDAPSTQGKKSKRVSELKSRRRSNGDAFDDSSDLKESASDFSMSCLLISSYSQDSASDEATSSRAVSTTTARERFDEITEDDLSTRACMPNTAPTKRVRISASSKQRGADDLPLDSPAATLSIGEHENESNVHDDTVYGVETTDGNSSGAMLWNPTDKYNSVCPPLIDTILEEFGLTRNDLEQHPLLAGVLETFESKEILPARERLLAIDGSANARDQSDAAAASVVEENCYNEGSIIDISNLDDLPQECALLGLHGMHSKSMDNNPPTEGHGELLRLIRKYSPQFESAKQDGTDDTTVMVVRRMYDELFTNYSIIVLSHTKGSTYKVKPSSYSINASVSMHDDSGSIRKILYNKLNKYHASLSNNFLENIEQAKISYFQEKLDGCTHTLGNADNFVAHCNLTDGERMNPNSGIENFESILATLKEEHPPSPSPSEEEETGPNIHSATLEVVIRDSDLFELFLSLEDDCDNSETWKKIAALVKDNDSIPDHLKGLFNEPDWLGIENGHRSQVVGHMLLDLIKVLSLQCWRSNYKISECDCKEELSSLELDHNLAYYHKSFTPSKFHCSDSTDYRNPYGLQNKLKRALYECCKCCMVHFMLHSRGKFPPTESQIEEGMRRPLILNYDTQVEAVLEQFGGAASITFRQFFTLKEAVLLAMDWLSRGAFRETKKPLVKWEALAIAPMLLFETALPDIMKYTKTEYNQLAPGTRVRAAINAIRTLMARLSGGCSRHEHRNCKLIRAKMNSWQIQEAMEMNHRDPSEKNVCMSRLRNPADWHKEGCNGDCENECRCCHCKINAFQNGGPRPPGYTGK